EAPIETVASDTKYKGGSDYTDLYDYEVYEVDARGNRTLADKNSLKYDTDYVAVLSPKNDNAVFVDDAEVEHPFHTGIDPSNIQIDVPLPDYDDKLPYTGAEQTLNIRNWNDIKDHIADIVRDDGVTGEDAFKATDVGTYKVTLTLRTDENAFWKGTDKIEWEVVFEVTVREIERPNLPAVVYNGNVFDIMNYVPADYEQWVNIEIFGYTPNVDGTTSVDEDGNYIVKRAGVYDVRFTLVDPVNTKWKGEDGNVGVGFRVALLEDNTSAIETTWEVQKAQIKGKWNEDGSFTPENAEDESKYDIVYIDENGNEAKFGEFEDGLGYRGIATLKGEYLNDYEFAEDLRFENDPAVTRTEFTKTASFWERALAWLKKYWIWLVIATLTLVFLILSIVMLARKKQYADETEFEEELEDEIEIEEEPEEEEEELPEPVTEEAAATADANSGA
ncbi:MAG: hypothetical protein K2N74_00835, partial [Clostridiales bacterium]|nr:hypothetical protein [Clostridiales bacterium]